MPHLAEAYYAGADTPAATVALPPVAPAAPAAPDDDDHLPAGWTMHFDPSSGSLYYHHASTGTYVGHVCHSRRAIAGCVSCVVPDHLYCIVLRVVWCVQGKAGGRSPTTRWRSPPPSPWAN